MSADLQPSMASPARQQYEKRTGLHRDPLIGLDKARSAEEEEEVQILLIRLAAIVQAPGANAVLMANPADKAIYFYKERMAASMGSFSNYSRESRAVLVVDRSLRERSPGIYETTARLGRSGSSWLSRFPRVFMGSNSCCRNQASIYYVYLEYPTPGLGLNNAQYLVLEARSVE